MTQMLERPAREAISPDTMAGPPVLDDRVVVRVRLEQELENACDSILTVVQAPTGSGKTMGVARWAATPRGATDRSVWLDAGRLDAGRGADNRRLFWNRVRCAFDDSGIGPIAAVPDTSVTESSWTSWLHALADLLNARGDRWLLVLDDFPSGPDGTLGHQLGLLLARTTRSRVLITCTGPPAVDLARIGGSGRISRVGVDALRMDISEVAELLRRRGLPSERDRCSAITTHAAGWARGVDLAAGLLSAASGSGLGLGELEAVIDDVIEAEVLAQIPAAGRELVIRTSVAPEVSPGLAGTIMGGTTVESEAWIDEAQGFVEMGSDHTWRCHPLLRRAAARRLQQDWPSLARESRRGTARWNVESGDRAFGLELAAEIEDWAWAASALVRSLAVPSILLGAADPATVDIVDRTRLASSEPLILAASAVAAGEPEVVEAALTSSISMLTTEAAVPACLARRLSDAIVRMAAARASGDAEAGLKWARRSRCLWAELPLHQRLSAPEVPFVVAANEAACWLELGDLARAVSVVEPAQRATEDAGVTAVAISECVGLLAWLQALRGNLAAADRAATQVLTRRPAGGDEIGVGYAQLAEVWVHLEQGALAEARQRLDHLVDCGHRNRDPRLIMAQRMAVGRLATLQGEPDLAVRLLLDIRRTQSGATEGWLADRCTVAIAEAQLRAGDAQRALAALTPEPRRTRVEARVVAAQARHSIGDRRGARALIAGIGDRAGDAPLTAVVQLRSLDAQLAAEAGDSERALSLLTRALRAAHREQLRSALSPSTSFIAACVNRHPDLARDHRSFLASLATEAKFPPVGERFGLEPADVLEALTERELEVLERLAQFLTTDEIAADLFLSANTVKTHIKSVFLKLSVNRRADAVRRGRGLGLC